MDPQGEKTFQDIRSSELQSELEKADQHNFGFSSGRLWLKLKAAYNASILVPNDHVRNLPLPGSIIGRRRGGLKLRVKEHQLFPGNVLVIHMDGLTENTGPDGTTLNLNELLNN